MISYKRDIGIKIIDAASFRWYLSTMQSVNSHSLKQNFIVSSITYIAYLFLSLEELWVVSQRKRKF